MARSVKEAFKAKAKTVTPVEIEGIGTVHIRKLKLKDQRELKRAEGEAEDHYAARLAACVICNADGTSIFDPANEEDIALLMETDLEDLRIINEANMPAGNLVSASSESASSRLN